MSTEHNDILKARVIEAEFRIKDLEAENARLLERLGMAEAELSLMRSRNPLGWRTA